MNAGGAVPDTFAVGLAPLTVQVQGSRGTLVGRAAELAAVRQEIGAARAGRVTGVALEGEPGIGKSRLLVAAAELAVARGFACITTAADEEFRGPFLVARSVFGSPEARRFAKGVAGTELARAHAAISGRDDPGVEGLAPDEKLLRAFDLGAVAIRALASSGPLALLIDDLQWADDDSLRLLRYVVRTVTAVPLFVAAAVRPEEAAGTEAALLLADMERMGVVRRLRVGRMTQAESAELVRLVLGGPAAPQSGATMHAQAEGVPFILQELARTYRDAGLIQEIDGIWALARSTERLVPSAVRTLIQRRAARLPEATRAVLAEAAVIGRHFAVVDVVALREQLGSEDRAGPADLAERLAPAVAAGLLVELPPSGPADYRFAHEQVREFAAGTLTPPRRRAIHAALVELLTAGATPADERLPIIARHALEAGDVAGAARFSIDAAHAALAARAPEEVLRLVDLALNAVSSPQDRLALLTARDDALEMLRRPIERIEGLTELAALAEALGDRHLALVTMLRRSAALRLAGEDDRAAQLAAEVRAAAVERGDREAELAACLELGQAHLRRPLGESYTPSAAEADLDQAEEAYRCACELARALDDPPALAAATRELGVITSGRVRAWYVDFKRTHGLEPIVRRVADGEQVGDIVAGLGVAPLVREATGYLEQAIALFDEVGDRRGMISAIIAMAYLRFAPDIHLQASARRIEEIRHLTTQLVSLSRESERDRAEAQMLYGVHVFARAKVVPDLALSRGVEAYEKAHLLGERTLEFLAAGGVAMVHLELDDVIEAERWIDRAATTAAVEPTPFKARQLALWRGSCFAAAGDAERMREQLEHAVELAESQRRPAASCEVLAHTALEAARLGEQTGDEELFALAERCAADAKAIVPSLPGHPLWGARADVALARVALGRDDPPAAAAAARDAMAALTAADLEDLSPEIRLPAGRALLAGGTPEERELVRAELRTGVLLIAQRILDEDLRVRWFRGPYGRELTELTGSLDPFAAGPRATIDLEADDVRLLRLLVEGRTNHDIAETLGLGDDAVERLLAGLYARTGSASRAEVTTFAFREGVI